MSSVEDKCLIVQSPIRLKVSIVQIGVAVGTRPSAMQRERIKLAEEGKFLSQLARARVLCKDLMSWQKKEKSCRSWHAPKCYAKYQVLLLRMGKLHVAVGTRPSAMQRVGEKGPISRIQSQLVRARVLCKARNRIIRNVSIAWSCRSWHAPECYAKSLKYIPSKKLVRRSWHAPECYAK